MRKSEPKRALVRLRIDLAPGCSIGPGKVDLLDAIDEAGSLSVAARNLGMSYRRAWLLVADLNRSFESAVVTLAAGGANGGGAIVTPAGRALIAAFREVERGAEALARKSVVQIPAPAPPTKGLPKARKVTGRVGAVRPRR